MNISLILANIVGACGFVLACWYALRRGAEPQGLDTDDAIASRLRAMVRHRRINAVLMALTAILFLVGINIMDRVRSEITLTIWVCVVAAIGVILVLAMRDLLALSHLRSQLEEQIDTHTKAALDLGGLADDENKHEH